MSGLTRPTLLGRLQQAVEWTACPEGSPIEAWRRRILAAMLLGVSALGAVAYVVGAIAAFRDGQLAVVVVDTVCYAAIIAITLGRRLPYVLRAGTLTVLPAVLGTYFLYGWGFLAAGFPWVMAFPVFASVLLGVRAGLVALGVLATILAGFGLLIPSGVFPWADGLSSVQSMWWVSASSALMLSGIVSLSVGYLFDGLGREAAARQAAVLEADRRERLASLGTLTGGIAHDFNNLLQPIVSAAEHARQLLPGRHEAEPLLDDILRSANRARILVRRILSFASPVSHGEREIVDVGALVQESERLLRAVLPAHIQLGTAVEEPVHVLADAADLQQVLLNLVTNAAHALPRGGTIHIRVQRASSADLADTVLANAPRVALLTVQDNGTGMSAETLSRVFEPFYTTRQPGRGTGLGLATVHATVTALGGIVRAESEIGRGTRMRVWLPLSAAERAAPVGERTPQAAPVPADTHVVVVDDEPAVLQATSRLIERLGYRVTSFDQPGRLLEQLDTLTPPPQVVLTDLSMPGYTGWELAELLHVSRPALPVVLMTGNLELADPASSAVAAPGDVTATAPFTAVKAVLRKPFTAAELQTTLHGLLG